MDITKEEFLAFEEVRQSGETNMMNRRAVEELTDGIVTKDIHRYIIRNFGTLAEQFLKESNEDWSRFGA